MFLTELRLMALSLGTQREQFEQRTERTCPRPFLLRPPPRLFLVILNRLDVSLVHAVGTRWSSEGGLERLARCVTSLAVVVLLKAIHHCPISDCTSNPFPLYPPVPSLPTIPFPQSTHVVLKW